MVLQAQDKVPVPWLSVARGKPVVGPRGSRGIDVPRIHGCFLSHQRPLVVKDWTKKKRKEHVWLRKVHLLWSGQARPGKRPRPGQVRCGQVGKVVDVIRFRQ